MMLTLFPYSFVRYASLHQREMTAFDPPEELMLLLSDFRVLEAKKEESKHFLCERLFDHIQQTTNDKQRQQLINLRRAIFNDKPGNHQHIDPALIPLVSSHLNLVTTLQAALLRWQHAFDEETIRYRKILQAYAQHELLCRGILLSSPTLHTQLPSFIARDAGNFRHKELKTAYSLLRYLTRMAFKTSPFSTFTHTGIAVPAGDGQIVLSSDIRCGIRLNNKLFDYFRLLMVHHPVLNEILEIRLNPTIRQKDRQLQFLASYRNIESFQKISAGDVTNWLQSFLVEQRYPVLLGALTDSLSAHVPDADRIQIKAYLLQLVASGFLETGIGCSGVSPAWDQAFIKYLSAHEEGLPSVRPLLHLLQFLQQQQQAYITASATIRGKLLQEAGIRLNDTLIRLQREADLPTATCTNDDLRQQIREEVRIQKEGFNVTRFMLQQFPSSGIFYEDTYTPSVGTYASAATLALVQKADRLCTLLESLDTMQAERVRMRDFFLQHFGPGESVSVTDFYHSYYQLEKKVQKEISRDQVFLREDSIMLQLKQLLRADNITVISGTVDLTADDFDITITDTTTSRGMFIQLFQQEELYGVVNNILPGMGKVAGRFLDLFDPAITNCFREWNERLHPDSLQLELSDGSSFNANIHPPLLSYGIHIPGSHSNYSEDQLTSVEKVAVRYNPDTDLLSLIHVPDGREILAYDLSLQSFLNRSNFYQLLAHFNPDKRIPLRKLIEVVDEKSTAILSSHDADIICKPRITFEKHIILRRKAWVIKTVAIPRQEHQETDAAYYLRFNKWHAESELPAHVFLFLKSHAIPVAREEKQRMMKDDYKPQYICFTQPAMMSVFKKLLSRASQYIYVEEMLPHLSHLQAGTPVTEHLIHWYKY